MAHIPASLNWLIVKRGKLSGEIFQAKKALKRVQALIDKVRELENDLQTIDDALKLHHIKIDIENIKIIRPRINRLMFPYGEISRHVLDYLKLHYSNRPIPKPEIVNYLIKIHTELYKIELPYLIFTDATTTALCRLQRINKVIRIHNRVTREEGLWKWVEPKFRK